MHRLAGRVLRYVGVVENPRSARQGCELVLNGAWVYAADQSARADWEWNALTETHSSTPDLPRRGFSAHCIRTGSQGGIGQDHRSGRQSSHPEDVDPSCT